MTLFLADWRYAVPALPSLIALSRLALEDAIRHGTDFSAANGNVDAWRVRDNAKVTHHLEGTFIEGLKGEPTPSQASPICTTCGTDHSDSRDRAKCETQWRKSK